MDNRENTMIQMLEDAREEYKSIQKNIKWSVNNDIGFSCFEENMISSLIHMGKVKEKIRTLELCLQLKK